MVEDEGEDTVDVIGMRHAERWTLKPSQFSSTRKTFPVSHKIRVKSNLQTGQIHLVHAHTNVNGMFFFKIHVIFKAHTIKSFQIMKSQHLGCDFFGYMVYKNSAMWPLI